MSCVPLRWAWPWWLAAGLVIALNLAAIGARLSSPAPLNLWEPGLYCDAWRAAHGLPVYADALADHAATMYGPAWTWLLSLPLRVGLPLGVAWPRTASALCALLLVLGLWRGLRPLPPRAWPPLAAPALLLAPCFPCVSYYVEARPDLAALLTATAALALLSRGQETGRRGPWAAGLLLLGLAPWLKQPALAAAGVPLVASLLRARPLRAALAGSTLSWTLPPLIVAGLVLVSFRIDPLVHHYAVAVPSLNPIDRAKFAPGLLEGLARVPLPLALLALDLLRRRKPRGPGEAWTLAAAAISWPVGALALSRLGGDVNSWLPLLLSTHAWALLRLPASWSRARGHGPAARAVPALLGLLLLLGALLFQPALMWHYAFQRAQGDAARPRVIAALRALPGRGACPDDPALILEAGGPPGRCLVAELDADDWRGALPVGVVREVQAADWVVTVHGSWPLTLPERLLRQSGFAPAPSPLPGAYRLWVRVR